MPTRNITQDYVPISSLPSFEEADTTRDALTWDFSFPPSVDTERLYVRTRALGRVQRLAALQSSLVFEYQGPRTTFTPTIVGMNMDGTAMAGRIGKTQRAETNESGLIDVPAPAKLIADYFQSISVHSLNKAELADRVVEKRRVSERNTPAEKAWAEVVDAALSTSLRNVAKQNLVLRRPRPLKYLDGLVLGGATLTTLGDIYLNHYSDLAIFGTEMTTIWALFVATSAWQNKKTYGSTFIYDRKWTAMPYGGWQPDRYLAAAALTRTTELITARP